MATILFDWFGVVCNKALVDWAIGHNATDEIFREVLVLADRVDAGQIPLAEFQNNLAFLFGHSAEQVKQDLMARVVVNEDVIAIVRRLNEKHRVAVLSNVNAEFIAAIVAKHDLAMHFNPIIASSALKLVKPDPAIFKEAFEILQCRPEDIVFIDDTGGHIAAAKKLGITGIVFESAEQLEQELYAVGVL